MNIDKEYSKEVGLLLDKKDSKYAELKLRCANQANEIARLKKELKLYKLTDFSSIELGEALPDLLKPQAE